MAVSYPNLRCAIEAYPQWPAGTDQEIAGWVNTPSISHRPTDADPRAIWNVIIQFDEYETLSDGERDVVKTTLFGGGNSAIDISTNSTPEAVMLLRVFPAGSNTRAALAAAFITTITPAQFYNVGLAQVGTGHVAEARTWPPCGS